MARKDAESIRITSATRSHSEDIARRQRRYLISMGIRTLCFILAVVFAGGVLMWVFIIASFVLPYVAVVMANAGMAADPGGPDPFDGDPGLKQLPGPPRD